MLAVVVVEPVRRWKGRERGKTRLSVERMKWLVKWK